jgi:ppGpp synthetase/RelA/SpoT-type nucleotidyltranferase
MSKIVINKRETQLINELVAHFELNRHLFLQFVEQLLPLFTNAKALSPNIHSMKWRVKEPSHLKDKLIRKIIEAKESKKKFVITKENLFYKINDLAGFRIIHLYTRQIDEINKALLALFEEERYRMIERPTARTWDDESRSYFKEIGIKTHASSSMYTSVHYVIEPNRRTKITCEIQVRTLMEEVWGEVSHTINYPHKTESVACNEQLKVLAKVTSSCSRLVDSIFKTDEDYRNKSATSKPVYRRRKNKTPSKA